MSARLRGRTLFLDEGYDHNIPFRGRDMHTHAHAHTQSFKAIHNEVHARACAHSDQAVARMRKQHRHHVPCIKRARRLTHQTHHPWKVARTNQAIINPIPPSIASCLWQVSSKIGLHAYTDLSEGSSRSSRCPPYGPCTEGRSSDTDRAMKLSAHSRPCRSVAPPMFPMRSNRFPHHCISNHRALRTSLLEPNIEPRQQQYVNTRRVGK